MDHAPEDASRVFDGLATAELNIGGGEKHDLSAEFADADFKAHAGAGGRFGENEGPDLSLERFRGGMTAFALHDVSTVENVADFGRGEGLNGEKIFHGKWMDGPLQKAFGRWISKDENPLAALGCGGQWFR